VLHSSTEFMYILSSSETLWRVEFKGDKLYWLRKFQDNKTLKQLHDYS
jgi:hypothetical protein